MFFSLDLLSIRGGKMNTIWLLGTVKEKEAIIRKHKAELLKNDLQLICRDLVKRFPVLGKDKSFSLRMSSVLVYGAAINLRIQAEDLLKATLNLLSIKPASYNQGIDMVTTSNQDTKAGEPCPADLHLGLMELENLEERLELSPLSVRIAEREITMVEPVMTDLDYMGEPLPVLSVAELLAQTWDLEDPADHVQGEQDQNEPAVQVEQDHNLEQDCPSKRNREETDTTDTAAKKLRLDTKVLVLEESFLEAPELTVRLDAPELT
jgi:hypothetical protein